MDSKHAIELEKWEIKGFTAEKAIDLLTHTSFISGPNIMYAIAYLIQKQERDYRAVLSARSDTIEDMERRIAERDRIIERQEDQFREATKKIERQERMIGLACEQLQKIGCPILDDHYCDENCSTEMNGSGCWRRWLKQEAQHD